MRLPDPWRMRSGIPLYLLAPPLKISSAELPIQDPLRPDPPNLFAGEYRDDRFLIPPPQPEPLWERPQGPSTRFGSRFTFFSPSFGLTKVDPVHVSVHPRPRSCPKTPLKSSPTDKKAGELITGYLPLFIGLTCSVFGTPGKIRTYGLLLRRQTLYPG